MVANHPVKFLLFLDLDGVTHPQVARAPQDINELRPGDTYFRKENLVQINRVIHKLQAQVVITAAWRHRFSTEAFARLFMGRVLGLTPPLDAVLDGREQLRYREILRFLEQNGLKAVPWLALDSQNSHYPRTAPLIVTNPQQGLTEIQANTIIRWFAPQVG